VSAREREGAKRPWWGVGRRGVCRCELRFASGLCAVGVAELAKIARQFDAKIFAHKGDRDVDCTDLVSLLRLAVGPGETVALVARGAEARDAIRAIKSLFVSGSMRATEGAARDRAPGDGL
jgi:phosphotransferase system HPr (HPr) family protein